MMRCCLQCMQCALHFERVAKARVENENQMLHAFCVVSPGSFEIILLRFMIILMVAVVFLRCQLVQEQVRFYRVRLVIENMVSIVFF